MPHADLVFVNGPVFTVDPARRRARAVAVRGGRIAAVGHEARIRDLIGPGTEVVDLKGRLLLPGFQDAHVHPVFGGLTMNRCDLSEAETQEESLATVAAYAAANPGTEWVLGGGWSFDQFPGGMPTRQMLDAVVPDRPVYLQVADGHSGWANSRALEIAGLDRNSPDPADGRLEREADGTPAGVLHEGAMGLVGKPRTRLARTTSRASPTARRTCTRSASPPGRTPSSAPSAATTTSTTPTWRRPRAACSPPGSVAASGGTANRAPNSSTSSSTGAPAAASAGSPAARSS
jgi:predicted amidohydrolase YtcJ